ncbi:MAG: APC family permease [Acidobacteriota bacterium]
MAAATPQAPSPSTASSIPGFIRRLGAFDATMLVMGGIIGSGIFANPHEVALEVSTPALILGAWIVGGVVALLGALVYAELVARRPEVGGQYAYLREAFHPSVAFLYGWALLLVTQTGGMAAVAVIFARFFRSLTGVAWPEWTIALTALLLLTAINCLGVRAGSTVQSVLMVMKIGAVVALIACGLWWAPAAAPAPHVEGPTGLALLTAFGAALAPVLFAYGGWQTAGFVSGELKDPRRDMPRALLLGVGGVIVLYLAVNFVCLRVLGVAGLHQSSTPASDVMRAAFGPLGARWIEVGITISTLGFLSQGMLTAPRVYYAMARDGMFFKKVGELHSRSHVPVVATVVQGVMAMVIAGWGRYSQILASSRCGRAQRRGAGLPGPRPSMDNGFVCSFVSAVRGQHPVRETGRSRDRPVDCGRRVAGVRLLALARPLA